MRWTNPSPPDQDVVKGTLIFLKGKSIQVIYFFSFVIPLEIFSKLILADSTANQTRLFHGNSTPSWLKEQHDKEVHNSTSRLWAPCGFWPKMWTETWEVDKKAMKFYVFNYIYRKVNIKYRDVCIIPRLAWYSSGWMIFASKTQTKDFQDHAVIELPVIST